MVKANDYQVAGSHYQGNVLQHWDLVALYNWDYFQGQITKYVMRWRQKNGIEDLRKAHHYLEKYIELELLKQQGTLTRGILKAAMDELLKFELLEPENIAGVAKEISTFDERWQRARGVSDGEQHVTDTEPPRPPGHHTV